jgi:hypothetical protein
MRPRMTRVLPREPRPKRCQSSTPRWNPVDCGTVRPPWVIRQSQSAGPFDVRRFNLFLHARFLGPGRVQTKKNVDFLRRPSVFLFKSAGKIENVPNAKHSPGSNEDGPGTQGGSDMMAKILKSVIIVAMAMTFFGGTAMADRRGRDYDHSQKWDHSYSRSYHRAPAYNHHGRHDEVVSKRSDYRQPQYHASKSPSLAPRIVFFGGLPVPVPPPPDEVFRFLTGH